MAYFLKKSKLKKGVYLQIYESFHDPKRGHSVHRSFRPIGYVDDLIESGIKDPIEHFKLEVDALNAEVRKAKDKDKHQLISDTSPERYLGYFPLKNINDALRIHRHLDLLQEKMKFDFNVTSVLNALIYARAVFPCSKHRTYNEILPKLFETFDFSRDQMYSAIDFLGNEYKKVIEIFNHEIEKRYPFNTSVSYFDGTNFYFEIDKEDDFRKKGPSKENRRCPIVGMGLLLDANQVPLGMKLFPGNASEQPILREVIQDLKSRQNINGRTIIVADKGLNSAQNIYAARKNKDGYIFSKSVKQLPATEKEWVLLENDYIDVRDSDDKLLYRYKECTEHFTYNFDPGNGKIVKFKSLEKRVVTYNPKLAKKKQFEIQKQVEKAKKLRASQAKRNEYGDSSKYVEFKAVNKEGVETKDKISVTMNNKKIKEDMALAGYNLIVTSETEANAEGIYNAYHNLWRIEESFKIMKSDLDIRPVYHRNEMAIKGHFLICYLTVVLTRLLQFKVFENEFSSEDIVKFMHDFRVVKQSNSKYINISMNSKFIETLASKTRLPTTSYFLQKSQITKMLNHRFWQFSTRNQ